MRPLLRCLGLAAEPADQGTFYRTVIGRALRAGAREFLVSGTVDTALPDLIDAAAEGHHIALTVVDRCPTPVALIEQCASRRNQAVAGEVADILSWRPPRRFDAVLTHSFFGSVAPADRAVLLANWFALLKSGGLVATVVRLRPEGETTRFDRAGIDALADEAARRYAALQPAGEPTVEEFRAAVANHLGGRTTHPVRGLSEVGGLFETAGFDILSLGAEPAARRPGAVPGPAQPTGATYCHVVARRP